MNTNKNKNKSTNAKIRKLTRKVRKTRRVVNRIKRARDRVTRRKNIGAASIAGFNKKFSILQQTGNYMRIRGQDLIYKIPDQLESNTNTSVLTVIPANPAYWLGTRMAAIASGYQNYRPLTFSVHYVPQCAVTQQGNVIAGTLWDMSPNDSNLQQTLRTSNGGMLTQCYKSATSKVILGRNLQYNLYRMGGKFDQQSNPFIFIAMTIATVNINNVQINPGYFYVTYEYELRNPIGDTIKYYNSGLIQQQNYISNYINEALVNCSSPNAHVGSIIQKDEAKYTWNDKDITLQPTDRVWYFSNTVLNNGGDEPPQPEQEVTLQVHESVDLVRQLVGSTRYLVSLDRGDFMLFETVGSVPIYLNYNTSGHLEMLTPIASVDREINVYDADIKMYYLANEQQYTIIQPYLESTIFYYPDGVQAYIVSSDITLNLDVQNSRTKNTNQSVLAKNEGPISPRVASLASGSAVNISNDTNAEQSKAQRPQSDKLTKTKTTKKRPASTRKTNTITTTIEQIDELDD